MAWQRQQWTPVSSAVAVTRARVFISTALGVVGHRRYTKELTDKICSYSPTSHSDENHCLKNCDEVQCCAGHYEGMPKHVLKGEFFPKMKNYTR